MEWWSCVVAAFLSNAESKQRVGARRGERLYNAEHQSKNRRAVTYEWRKRQTEILTMDYSCVVGTDGGRGVGCGSRRQVVPWRWAGVGLEGNGNASCSRDSAGRYPGVTRSGKQSGHPLARDAAGASDLPRNAPAAARTRDYLSYRGNHRGSTALQRAGPNPAGGWFVSLDLLTGAHHRPHEKQTGGLQETPNIQCRSKTRSLFDKLNASAGSRGRARGEVIFS